MYRTKFEDALTLLTKVLKFLGIYPLTSEHHHKFRAVSPENRCCSELKLLSSSSVQINQANARYFRVVTKQRV